LSDILIRLAFSAFKAPKNKTTAVSLVLATITKNLTMISHKKIWEMRPSCPLSAPGKGPEDEPLLDRFRDARKPLLNALKRQGARHKLGRDVQKGCGRPSGDRLAAVPVVQAAGAVRAVPLAAVAAAAAVVVVASGLDHFHHDDDDDVAAGALGAQRNSFGLLSGPLSQSSEHDFFVGEGRGGHSR
jgi:hypothetical protein